MTKSKRAPVSPELIKRMNNELVEMPISGEKAAVHAQILEAILGQTKGLRKLPIKDIEPAPVFSLLDKRNP